MEQPVEGWWVSRGESSMLTYRQSNLIGFVITFVVSLRLIDLKLVWIPSTLTTGPTKKVLSEIFTN